MIDGLDWSYSKSQLFTKCQKAFFLDFVNRNTNQQYDKKQIVSLYSICGIIFHNTISKELDKWEKNESLDKQRAYTNATESLNNIIKHSDMMVVEALNGGIISDQFWKYAANKLRTDIDGFFTYVWPKFRSHKHVLHEKTEYVDTDFGKIVVRLDLCTKDIHDKITIIDWKTSKISDVQLSWKQLGAYVIWASDYFNKNPEEISLLTVNIPSNIFTEFHMTVGDLSRALHEINAECESWKVIMKNSNYDASPDLNKCMGCSHLNTCDVGIIFKGQLSI